MLLIRNIRDYINVYGGVLCYIFQPSVEIVCLWRSQTSLSEYGSNQLARWKPDSSRLAITVSFALNFLCILSHLSLTDIINCSAAGIEMQ